MTLTVAQSIANAMKQLQTNIKASMGFPTGKGGGQYPTTTTTTTSIMDKDDLIAVALDQQLKVVHKDDLKDVI